MSAIYIAPLLPAPTVPVESTFCFKMSVTKIFFVKIAIRFNFKKHNFQRKYAYCVQKKTFGYQSPKILEPPLTTLQVTQHVDTQKVDYIPLHIFQSM